MFESFSSLSNETTPKSFFSKEIGGETNFIPTDAAVLARGLAVIDGTPETFERRTDEHKLGLQGVEEK